MLPSGLHATFNLTADDARSGSNYAFRCSCTFGYLNVAKWLHATFNLTAADARSIKNNDKNMTSWLQATFGLEN